MEKLSAANGRWQNLVEQWETQCTNYGENFSDYATASLPVLESLAVGTQTNSASVYGIRKDDEYLAVCQANSTFLPKYEGKVLRIRHIVFSPYYDFEDSVSLEDYENVLVGVFIGALNISDKEMASDHLKFHLRSPVEMQFGESFTEAMEKHDVFTKSAMAGAWIYLSKT